MRNLNVGKGIISIEKLIARWNFSSVMDHKWIKVRLIINKLFQNNLQNMAYQIKLL
ncbi:hypothetical protein MCAV_03490 [[Mycoplasma] cavipharyngis]